MLLLQHNADVYIINGDGRLPRDVTQDNAAGLEINKLLRAAEATETRKLESKLLTAARDGDLDLLKRLVYQKDFIVLRESMVFNLFIIICIAKGSTPAQHQLRRWPGQ